tara:strand:+ start:235 stop:855 length:621 start_codon:yes stop_codon:yes gene_type:complete
MKKPYLLLFFSFATLASYASSTASESFGSDGETKLSPSMQALFKETMQVTQDELLKLYENSFWFFECELYWEAAQITQNLAENPPNDITVARTLNINTRLHLLILDLYHLAYQSETNPNIPPRQRFLQAAVFYQAAYIVAQQMGAEGFIPLIEEHLAQRDQALRLAIEHTLPDIHTTPVVGIAPQPNLALDVATLFFGAEINSIGR